MSVVADIGASTTDSTRNYVRMLRHWSTMLGLVIADVLAFAAGYYLLRRGHQLPAIVLSSSLRGPNPASATDVYLIMGAVFIVARYIFGDYGRRQLFWDGARVIASTICFVALPDVFLAVVLGNTSLYLPLAASWFFLFLAIPIFRQSMRWIMSKFGLWQISTALIGTGTNAREALLGLRGSLSLGFDVQFLVVKESQGGIPVELFNLRKIPGDDAKATVTALQRASCAQVVIAAEDTREPQMTETIQRLIGAHIDLAIIPSLRGFPVFGLSTNYLFGKDILLLQVRNNLARIPSRVIKRLVDLIGPLIVATVLSPLLVAIAIAIKLNDGGPIFFIQPRVGRGGRSFPCFKFRTMHLNAEETLAQWREENPERYGEYIRSNFKLRDDPRVTRVGRWLRRTSLDELPQILNVLVGDMSLVGPRPLLEREIPDYGAGFKLYQRTRPGITGLWQISGRSETQFADRVSYDEWYILNWSLWYDTVIVLHTIWIVCSRKGAF